MLMICSSCTNSVSSHIRSIHLWTTDGRETVSGAVWCRFPPPIWVSVCLYVCVAQHLAAMGLSSIVSAQRRAGKVLLSRWPLHCCCTFECWGVTYLNRLRALHSQMGWAKPKMLFYGGFVQYQNRRNIERTRTPEF